MRGYILVTLLVSFTGELCMFCFVFFQIKSIFPTSYLEPPKINNYIDSR